MNKKRKGFALIEVIAVAGIIGMVIVGLVGVAQSSIRAQAVNKNALIASMLAQEGLELVRKVRDENWRNGRPWTGNGDGGNTDILQDTAPPRGYAVYFDNNAASPEDAVVIRDVDDSLSDPGNEIIDEPEARLFISPDGHYTHDSTGAAATDFYRVIEITNLTPASMEATCKIRFSRTSGSHYDYVASTLLYNWW
jgi:type II secretory pathway pseudopilin PulG